MTHPVFRSPGDGGSIGNPLGGAVTFKVRGEESGGALTAFETIVPAGGGPPLHTHANEDESFYVLAGEVRFKMVDELQTGGPGTFAFVPRGVPHTWQAVGTEPARILIMFNPSGMERFFESHAGVDGADPGAFARLGAEVGMDVIGPPLAESDPI